MANDISYALAYLKMLDGIYKADSKTSILEANPLTIKFSQEDAKTIYLQELSIDGIGEYARATGYVASDADLAWQAYTLAQDWGVKVTLDTLDLKNAYMEIMTVGATIQREKFVPQVDAYRFEKLCTTAGLDVSADLTYDTAIAAIDTGIQTLDDAEVPQNDRVLFVSNTMYTLMKTSGEFFNVRMAKERVVDREIDVFDSMPLVRVPGGRFCNNFDFPTTTAGAFSKASGSKDLNFVILSKSAVAAVTKYADAKIVDKQFNTTADAYVYAYRTFHDLFVLNKKLNGVYIHAKSSTN